MGVRCRVCGLLQPTEKHVDRMGRCYACQGAYQRFRSDTGWGTTVKGGLKVVRGRLVNTGPQKEVPNVPSGNWFRYIVRERLLRGLSRYPYTYAGYEGKHVWNPDKMPPWPDVHTVPQDTFVIPPQQAVALGIAIVPHEEPSEPEGYIGPWGPPNSVR